MAPGGDGCSCEGGTASMNPGTRLPAARYSGFIIVAGKMKCSCKYAGKGEKNYVKYDKIRLTKRTFINY